MSLNQSVKQLSGRFETFQTNIESKVGRMQGEFTLMKNKVEFIEQNYQKKHEGSVK
jgi:hypothetical protein